LWVVFDRDSFAPQSFNNAINKCIQDRPNIDAAWSNEAFELWYLLHLIYFDNARKDYASHKPRTKVYELIKEFKDLIEQYANPPKEDDGEESE
jgi:hypothetical protein